MMRRGKLQMRLFEEYALEALRFALHSEHDDAREEYIKQALDYIKQADDAIT